MQSAVLDPLAPAPHGVWSYQGVQVRRRRGPHRMHTARDTVCTPRFCVLRRGSLVMVEHDLRPDELCDELATTLAENLVEAEALHGQAEFELVFTGVVRSTVDGGLSSWLRFYRNSITRLEGGATAFAPVHAWAAEQVLGHRLIDLGSCFGFFPLRMARQGLDVLATDLSGPAMHLLGQVSTEMRRPLTTLVCDAADVPIPDRSADTVTAIHLIEHLPTEAVDAVLDQAVRLARRRVVVAVPFEERPRECYGHIQRFDLARLRRAATRLISANPELSARVYEFHGGWLILDRTARS